MCKWWKDNLKYLLKFDTREQIWGIVDYEGYHVEDIQYCPGCGYVLDNKNGCTNTSIAMEGEQPCVNGGKVT